LPVRRSTDYADYTDEKENLRNLWMDFLCHQLRN
jgi:hypothetical protein